MNSEHLFELGIQRWTFTFFQVVRSTHIQWQWVASIISVFLSFSFLFSCYLPCKNLYSTSFIPQNNDTHVKMIPRLDVSYRYKQKQIKAAIFFVTRNSDVCGLYCPILKLLNQQTKKQTDKQTNCTHFKTQSLPAARLSNKSGQHCTLFQGQACEFYQHGNKHHHCHHMWYTALQAGDTCDSHLCVSNYFPVGKLLALSTFVQAMHAIHFWVYLSQLEVGQTNPNLAAFGILYFVTCHYIHHHHLTTYSECHVHMTAREPISVSKSGGSFYCSIAW